MTQLYGEQLQSPAAREPVLLEEAREHLRVYDQSQDAIINGLIVAAREYCETLTKRAFITQTWLVAYDMFPRLYPLLGGSALLGGTINSTDWNILQRATLWLPRPPCQGVTQIQYIDPDGNLQTWDSSLYVVDTIQEPTRILPQYGVPWPLTRYLANAVQITQVCGYGDTPESVPQTIRQAMLMLIGHWYVHRESVSEGPMAEVPQAVDVLLRTQMWGSYIT